ncbi:MAG: hypothetical protein A3H57_04355 [Candidatus Taylorbacteria bacterium RIFCSPLOWO2_02_FULL_43_11]|uniref:Signal peptidase I n=1 Tax=Candidatus Taylorbacteria bacterium RIFCSPHIGHO2_02_FULL_43_32b TaxID=1802306 RepID=A0A1G2MGY3_9BACT|nr:MAG: hypothetical protein A2743_02095 [Candidatus Taylorbacteria bacterium RIFCSPHIGHO2_01_FULL_43_47]OHA22429.1 MAG: hypothetical protein A3C72_03305 [Candidatus Taylorbacteria bacterium RIFCSPHIGHO2_02_FULL_43_32b]OHA31618.1 MAG: hypothetical protein A3B08_04015 [Candidatus Taylorbacteria bacterium RIFCSPLOWO2_01_FULL_43_44]OHA36198.1 MAG: hypothetical protein A3H57_04355 [Candidatus Taylorbacteria bacterium RIFCSPLOWO2_02_FULL_43_11]
MFDTLLSIIGAVSNPSMMAAVSSTCIINGQSVNCADFSGPMLAFFGGFWLVSLFLAIFIIAANWKIYGKAGKPGWTSIVPIYNIVVLLEIVGKPTWWILLWFIPVVNIVIVVIVMYRLAMSFGKGVGFTIGLFFLPFIFYPMLAWGRAEYHALPDSIQATPPVPPVNPPQMNTPQAPVSGI